MTQINANAVKPAMNFVFNNKLFLWLHLIFVGVTQRLQRSSCGETDTGKADNEFIAVCIAYLRIDHAIKSTPVRGDNGNKHLISI